MISEGTLWNIWGMQPAPPLQLTDVRLQTYTGKEITVVGWLTVKVCYQGQEKELPLIIVEMDPTNWGETG